MYQCRSLRQEHKRVFSISLSTTNFLCHMSLGLPIRRSGTHSITEGSLNKQESISTPLRCPLLLLFILSFKGGYRATPTREYRILGGRLEYMGGWKIFEYLMNGRAGK